VSAAGVRDESERGRRGASRRAATRSEGSKRLLSSVRGGRGGPGRVQATARRARAGRSPGVGAPPTPPAEAHCRSIAAGVPPQGVRRVGLRPAGCSALPRAHSKAAFDRVKTLTHRPCPRALGTCRALFLKSEDTLASGRTVSAANPSARAAPGGAALSAKGSGGAGRLAWRTSWPGRARPGGLAGRVWEPVGCVPPGRRAAIVSGGPLFPPARQVRRVGGGAARAGAGLLAAIE
jgi:hypothetical protein